MFSDVNRRRFLGGALALGATTVLAACGYQEDTTQQGSESTWSFKDDRGRTLDGNRPERIVAQVTAAAALWEFGIRPVGIFGPSKLPTGKPDPQVGNVDLASVQSLGNVWGEFNYDRYVELKPQLLVSVMYLKDELWYVPAEQAGAVERAAPTVGLDLGGISITDGIEKFRALAKALGGDVDSDSVKKAKAEFDSFTEDFPQTVNAVGDKKLLLVSATQEGVWAGNAQGFPSSKYLADNGLSFVEPNAPGDGNYWEQLSWENAGTYPADVILLDSRYGNLQADQLGGYPTWQKLPAVQEGNVIPWNPETPFSYSAAVGELGSIGTALRAI
ncbi:iron complex transporter substrate-binding protein [Prauserella marina]|uniref:Iron complex transport system substrate-binding protein n=1 Tax=Prauserella marina TaxID=530584 RepID=A0A222VXT2_9PSEU|nr:iron complex transporter substrate-binding protein [Prauserella marina]PWV82057.1 iron complex transport system substrate-binding protein [Prauserella marina]SDD18478.1 iron complex transport system substrate-binding protein [Prauserella marina]